MKKWIRIRFEVFLIWVAEYILIERNVARCQVVSRRDNNDMWHMAEQLESIRTRMKNEYK